MLKKKGILGLLLLVLCSFVVVEAKEALTSEKFEEKMEDLGYETMGYGGTIYAYPKDEDDDDTVQFVFREFEDADEAQEILDDAYEETDEYDDLKRSKTSSGNSSCIKISGKEDGEYAYLLACRVDNTIVMGMTDSESKTGTVDGVLKDLGYYSSSAWVVILVVAVVVAIVAAVVVVIISSSKKKNNNGMNMNGMYSNNGFNQPMNNGFNQPMNNMAPPMNNMGMPDNGMNNGFNQPMNNMAPPMNNMGMPDNGMNNGFNQPVNNGFNQPVNNMDPNMNNNPMNNNFPNMN